MPSGQRPADRDQGKDLEQLQEIATDLAGKIEKVKGTQNVDDGMEEHRCPCIRWSWIKPKLCAMV